MDFSQPEQYRPIGPGSKTGGPTGPGPGFDGGPDSGMPCQQCGRGPATIQSYMWVMSFFVLTRHLEYRANLCRACSTRTGLKEQAKSALLGWWGIPWGLMTFQALWINARTLARWSTLPALVGMLSLVVSLAVPVGIGYTIWGSSGNERQAKTTGDWVDEEVVSLVNEGHRRYNDGRIDEALASYQAAYEKAPRSSVVNSSVAQALIDLGRMDEALPYAARAAKLDPETPAWAAMHGYVLAKVEGPEAARPRALALRSIVPKDAGDAIWMADLFDVLGDYDQELRVVQAGLALEPGATNLEARELVALVELDRIDEAGALVDELSFDGPGGDVSTQPYMGYALELYRMRTEPLATAEDLCSGWADRGYTDRAMTRLALAAERAGQLEETRAAVRRCLHDPATPSTAWASAEPWFADTWTAELDDYLADRPEPLPALLRLARYDPVTETRAIRRLAARVDAPDDPLAQYVDSYAYGTSLPGEPLNRRIEALEDHLEAAPDHVVCRSLLCGILARSAPDRAAAQLQVLDQAARDDPALAVAVALERTEMLVALGEVEQAVATIQNVDPQSGKPYAGPTRIDLEAAEAAFHAGRKMMLQKRLARLLDADEGSARAAALLIRWSDELAAGAPITYREDVDRLLEQAGDSLLSEESPSVQGILIAEGRVDPREREARVPEEKRDTLVLVRLFHDAAERGRPDLEAFARLAGSPHPTEFAPLLAKTALARRGQAREDT